ncbi:MAG: hypothetical protein SVO01_06095, partial [Thermotogota bacterium]|nr:hypothetical protein [Thermotogota bacterium]
FKDTKGNEIQDISNWFYSRIKKYGYYKPEKDYKTYEQLQVEKQAEAARKKEQAAEDLKRIRENKENAEKELLLERILADPDSSIHIKCFDITEDWEKGPFKNPRMRRGERYRNLISKSIDKLFDEGDEDLAVFLDDGSNPSQITEKAIKEEITAKKEEESLKKIQNFAKDQKKEGHSPKEILKLVNQTLKMRNQKPVTLKVLKDWGIN